MSDHPANSCVEYLHVDGRPAAAGVNHDDIIIPTVPNPYTSLRTEAIRVAQRLPANSRSAGAGSGITGPHTTPYNRKRAHSSASASPPPCRTSTTGLTSPRPNRLPRRGDRKAGHPPPESGTGGLYLRGGRIMSKRFCRPAPASGLSRSESITPALCIFRRSTNRRGAPAGDLVETGAGASTREEDQQQLGDDDLGDRRHGEDQRVAEVRQFVIGLL